MAPTSNRRLVGASFILAPILAIGAASLWRSGGEAAADLTCVSRVEEREVRGDSLTGVVEAGTTVWVELGFYGCNEVGREEIVLLRYAGNSVPIAKIVKGLPGDRFGVTAVEGKLRLLLNGEPACNHAGESYLLDLAARRVLGLYERDYQGIIPADAFLVFGNQVARSIDSRSFGLVSRADLLGRIQPPGD